MFIGQYDHSIDDKSRITLPARFRDALADGVVLSKGLDGSVDVYPKDAWQMTIAERIGRLDPLAAGDAHAAAPLLRRRRGGHARQAGARAPAGPPPPLRKPRPRTSRWSGATTTSRSGIAPPGRSAWRGSKGARTMLPNVLPNSASDHTPVLADEVRRLLAVQPGETVVDATFGAGGHARLLAEDLAGQRQARRDRPRPERQAALRPLQGAGRGRRPLPPRRLRDRPHPAGRERHQGRRDPARHRRLVDADRPARARLLVRHRRAARHADGSVRRDRRPRRSSTRGTRRSSRRSSAASARSATPGRSPARSCAAAPSARSSAPATSST